MKIRILGSRGEVEERSPRHSKHSGVLIDGILFDLGEKEYLDLKPSAIFITHLHPDHAFFVKDKVELPDIPIYAPEEFTEGGISMKVISRPTKIDNFKITPIPTFHSKKVESVGYLIEDDSKVFYSGDMIWIPKEYHKLLKGVDLVITEASSLERDLIRKDKETGEIYGHSSVERLLKFFSKFTKNIVLTHFGSDFIKDPDKGREKILEMSNGLNVKVAFDGLEMDTLDLQISPSDVEPITPERIHEIRTGLYLTEPHGMYIYDGSKSLIVKEKKYEEHIREELVLLADKLAYGLIFLKEPYQISKEDFEKRRSEHRITDEEVKKWNFDFPLWAYEFDFFPFEYPRPVRVPQGVQVFVDYDKLEFPTFFDLTPQELEFYHSKAHSAMKEEGDPWNELHDRVVMEMKRRGMIHIPSKKGDRTLELIRTDFETYIKEISKIPDKQLGDDFRIVLAWYSSLRRGKTLRRHIKE